MALTDGLKGSADRMGTRERKEGERLSSLERLSGGDSAEKRSKGVDRSVDGKGEFLSAK